MKAADRLSAELRKIGLKDMADAAASGHYGDYTSSLPMPITQLVNDLKKVGTDQAKALARRAMYGDFDGD